MSNPHHIAEVHLQLFYTIFFVFNQCICRF
nr:MAG TPA_asm: hypothetical protein [Caudoviricetes sp.]